MRMQLISILGHSIHILDKVVNAHAIHYPSTLTVLGGKVWLPDITDKACHMFPSSRIWMDVRKWKLDNTTISATFIVGFNNKIWTILAKHLCENVCSAVVHSQYYHFINVMEIDCINKSLFFWILQSNADEFPRETA